VNTGGGWSDQVPRCLAGDEEAAAGGDKVDGRVDGLEEQQPQEVAGKGGADKKG
jgi:hypothetical protein